MIEAVISIVRPTTSSVAFGIKKRMLEIVVKRAVIAVMPYGRIGMPLETIGMPSGTNEGASGTDIRFSEIAV